MLKHVSLKCQEHALERAELSRFSKCPVASRSAMLNEMLCAFVELAEHSETMLTPAGRQVVSRVFGGHGIPGAHAEENVTVFDRQRQLKFA